MTTFKTSEYHQALLGFVPLQQETVRHWCEEGLLGFRPAGKQWRIPERDIRQHLPTLGLSEADQAVVLGRLGLYREMAA